MITARTGMIGILAALCAGCSTGGGAEADTALARRQIAEQVNGTRACATLVAATGPLDFSADLLSAASIEALVRAGVVRREALTGDPGDRPRARIVPGPAGGGDVRLTPARDGTVTPRLCFGTRMLTSVRPESDGAGGQRMRYVYRIVDTPAWTRDPGIRRAFPFLVRLTGSDHEARAAAFLTDGKWIVPGDADAGMATEIGNKGFLPCPVPDPDRASPCT